MLAIRTLLVFVMAFATASFCHADVYTQTLTGANTAILTFTATLPAASDASLTLVATGGELNNGNKRLENLTVDGDTYTTPGAPIAGYMLPTNQPDGGGVVFPDPVTIPIANLNGYVADGQVVVSVVKPGFISGGTYEITLSYTSAVPEPSTVGLLALGSLALIAQRRKRANL